MTVTSSVLETESGSPLQTQSGLNILLENELYVLPPGRPDVRISVLSPSANSVIELDASGDLAGSGSQVQYERTPGGCGGASVVFGLRYEECYARGYATAMNIFEISTGDDVLQQNITTGATKLYVTSYQAYYNPFASFTQQQIYLWDGANLTMRIPVTGGGVDSGGQYITVGSPLAGGGNPTTIPAYTAGATIIGRRRYAGYVSLCDRPKQGEPKTTITCVPLAQIFSMTMGSYSFQTSANVDIGTAIYEILANFATPGGAGGFATTLSASCAAGASSITLTSVSSIAAGTYIVLDYGPPGGISERVLVASVSGSVCTLVTPTQYAHANGATAQSQPRWPQFYVSQANFPTLGITFVGTVTTTSVLAMIQNILGAISSGDIWSVIVDHDRIPRLVRLFILSGNAYVFPVTLTQGQIDFEPTQIQIVDQNASNLANAVLVTGNTNPATNQPYNAVVDDPASIAIYDGLQFDAQPVSITGLGSDAACGQYGGGLLATESLAQLQGTFRVYGEFVNSPAYQPQGLPSGDAVDGWSAVYLAGFDQIGVSANNVPDSEFVSTFVTGLTSTVFAEAQASPTPSQWYATTLTVVNLIGPSGSNAVVLSASGTGYANSPFFYVAPGRTFNFSVYIDASHVTAGTVQALVCVNDGIVVATLTQTNGTASTISTGQFTLPAGSNTCFIQFVCNGVTLSSSRVIFSQPMLPDGGTIKPYVPNYGAPTVFGLVSSAATTITSHGDRYQDITFAPIQPDWTSALAEQANALAAQIRQNQPPPTNVAQYTVSQSMFPLSYSGSSLVVTVPSSIAIFAAGSNPVMVGGNTFTLPATAVSWVWLNANNTYTIQQAPNTVAGAILLGFFQTSSIGVNGFTQKASVGVVQLSTFNGTTINPANGYITIADQAVHLTPQTIALPAAGVGSALEVGWNAMVGSASVNEVLWLFSDLASQNGYAIEWLSTGYVEIVKYVSGAPTVLATSASAYSKSTTSFNGMQVFVGQAASGSVLIVVQVAGVSAVAYTDSSSPFTSGYVGPQFSGATVTNQIDPNSIISVVGAAVSSALLKAQANIIPATVPGWSLNINSPTASGVGGLARLRIFQISPINPTSIYFPDGSIGTVPANVVPLNDFGGLDGVWYYSLGLVLATMTGIYYLSQTAPTNAQLQAFYADGVQPLAVAQTLTVAAGAHASVTGGNYPGKVL